MLIVRDSSIQYRLRQLYHCRWSENSEFWGLVTFLDVDGTWITVQVNSNPRGDILKETPKVVDGFSTRKMPSHMEIK